jgi:hypothetical protein
MIKTVHAVAHNRGRLQDDKQNNYRDYHNGDVSMFELFVYEPQAAR